MVRRYVNYRRIWNRKQERLHQHCNQKRFKNLSDAVKRSWDALDEETRKRLEGFGGGEK